MKKLLSRIVFILSFCSASAIAQSNVVVIPLGSDGLPFPKAPFANSNILMESQQARVNGWIGSPYKEWQKCYTLTTDGASAATFHSQCNHRGPSVTIFSINNKVFGGYTENSWNSSVSYAGYDRAFLFSITADKKYPVGSSYDKTTFNSPSYGPTFGTGHDIYVNVNMQLAYCNFPYTFATEGVTNSPTNPASAELCGVAGAFVTENQTFTELEVWVEAN